VILHVLWEDGDEYDRGHIHGVFSSLEALADARNSISQSAHLEITVLALDQSNPRLAPAPPTSSSERYAGLDALAQQMYVDTIADQLSKELTLREVDGSPGRFVLIERFDREADK